MEIYVIRHTPVDLAAGICYGQSDVPLLENNREAIASFKHRIPTELDRVICSPLQRCTKLAREFTADYTTDPRLMEMNFGAWEMRKWSEIGREQIELWSKDIVTTCPPAGENLQLVFNRTADFLTDLRSMEDSKILIVTHAGILRCIWSYILEIPLKNSFKIPVNYGEVLRVNLGKTADSDYIIAKM